MAKFCFAFIAFALLVVCFAEKVEKTKAVEKKDDLDTAEGHHYGHGHGGYGYAQLSGYGGNSHGHYGGYGHGHFSYGLNQLHPGGYGYGGHGHHGGFPSHQYHQQSYSGYYPSHSFGYGGYGHGGY